MLYHPISHSKGQIRLDRVSLAWPYLASKSCSFHRDWLCDTSFETSQRMQKMAPTHFLQYKEHEHIRSSCLAHSDASNDTSHSYDTFGKHLTWGQVKAKPYIFPQKPTNITHCHYISMFGWNKTEKTLHSAPKRKPAIRNKSCPRGI